MTARARVVSTLGLGSTAFAVFVALGVGGGGAAFVSIPYVLLAVASRRASNRSWAVAVFLFAASTAFGVYAVTSDAQGGLAFLWIVPGQLLGAGGLAAVTSKQGPRGTPEGPRR